MAQEQSDMYHTVALIGVSIVISIIGLIAIAFLYIGVIG